MRTEGNDYSAGLSSDPWTKPGAQRSDGYESTADSKNLLKSNANDVPDSDELDHLAFSESVKIISEAMKSRIRDAALGAGQNAPEAPQGAEAQSPSGNLSDLVKALQSAQNRGDLEKSSQATVARLISDIQNSANYNQRGVTGNNNGTPPSLLNMSA